MKFQFNLNFFLNKSLAIGAALSLTLFTMSCSDYTTQTIEIERANGYQIGAQWNRSALDQSHWAERQVFRLYRLFQSDVGVGVYLGEFNSKHLMLTANHNFPDLESCDEDINFITMKNDWSHYYYCTEIVFRSIETDSLIFSFTSDDFEALSKIQPASISDQRVQSQEALTLITARREDITNFYTQHYTDESIECRAITSEFRVLQDMDQNAQDPIQSWSQPIGCDGMHGDSGAPIYNQDQKLVGILWTGKFPKDSSSNTLTPMNQNLIWENYNYMVPFFKIIEELQGTNELDSATQEFLNSI